MPRIRLLADNAMSLATGLSGQDASGNPVFDAAAGETIPVVIDATGYVGSDSIAASAWSAVDGGTVAGEATAGNAVSCRFAVPSDAVMGAMYRVRHTLTLTGGPIRKTTLWVRTAAR